jgi:hypothetical protein
MRYDAHLQTRISKTDMLALKKLARARNESIGQYVRRRFTDVDLGDETPEHPMSDREIRYALADMPHATPWHDGEDTVVLHVLLPKDDLRRVDLLALAAGQSRAAYTREYIEAILGIPEDDDES